MKFRDLTADEIECRVKKIKDSGAVVLLYKTARCDYNLLDEVVSPEMWQCDFREVKGNMYCTIRVWNKELQQWIGKENCGVESRDDGEGNEKKGEASDAFKRAGFAWGIGRKLYTAPFIFVSADNIEIKKNDKGGYYTNDTLSVASITYDDTQITALSIINDRTKKEVYKYPQTKKSESNKASEPPKSDRPTDAPNDICPLCKKKIAPAFSKKMNREMTGAEILAAYGGGCPECYEKFKASQVQK